MAVLSFMLGQYIISTKANSFANGYTEGKRFGIVRLNGETIAQKFSEEIMALRVKAMAMPIMTFGEQFMSPADYPAELRKYVPGQ